MENENKEGGGMAVIKVVAPKNDNIEIIDQLMGVNPTDTDKKAVKGEKVVKKTGIETEKQPLKLYRVEKQYISGEFDDEESLCSDSSSSCAEELCSDDSSSCSGRNEIDIIDSDLYFAMKKAMSHFLVTDGKSLAHIMSKVEQKLDRLIEISEQNLKRKTTKKGGSGIIGGTSGTNGETSGTGENEQEEQRVVFVEQKKEVEEKQKEPVFKTINITPHSSHSGNGSF